MKDKKWLEKHYSTMSNKLIAKRKKRTILSVQYIAKVMKLSKDPEFMKDIHVKGAKITNRNRRHKKKLYGCKKEFKY